MPGAAASSAPVLRGFLPRLHNAAAEYERMAQMFAGVGYDPSPEQERVHRAVLEDGRAADGVDIPRLVVLGGGLQAGKSYLAGYHALARFPMDAIVWLVGHEYPDTWHEYSYLRDAAVQMHASVRYSTAQDGPWDLHYVNGAYVRTIASKDITKLSGEAPDFIVMCEAARQTYEAFDTCMDRVTPKRGTLLVSGTFEQQGNWYRNLWRECSSPGNSRGGTALSLPSYSNRRFYPDGINDRTFWKRKEQLIVERPVDGEDRFAERFLGIPRVPSYLVFREFRRDLHVQESADFDPTCEVTLAVDPGYTDHSAFAVLWIQVRDDTICIFDEIYVHGVRNTDILTMVTNHRAFPKVTRVVMDIAATQHPSAQTSAEETWRSHLTGMGRHISFGGQKVPVQEGIVRTHDKLGVNPITRQPYLKLHPQVRNLAHEMEDAYQYRVRSDGFVHTDVPIDGGNDACKALAYFIVDRWGLSDIPRKALPAPTIETMPHERVDWSRGHRASVGAGAAGTGTGRWSSR